MERFHSRHVTGESRAGFIARNLPRPAQVLHRARVRYRIESDFRCKHCRESCVVLRRTLAESWQTMAPESPNAGAKAARLTTIDLERGYGAAVDRIIQLGDMSVRT